ncbi:hypothetical protein BJX66DRAFT_295316 [Aspergillus keveii]|uniref:Uncharacterized protein n=1 Tax=Aspergillus keveii TaxID=714993 RepID=A0ABR4GI32_9EURO
MLIIDRFELFGNPQAHESDGIKVMYNGPDCYFDFINYTLDPDSPAQESIYRIKMAIRISCEIYRRRAESNLPHNESIGLLEQLRLAVLEINSEIEGSHALVWPYFVAAAESILPSHRDFFSGRLWAIYNRTQFRNITRALGLLDMIWELHGVRRWTEVVENDGPVLVM